MPLPPPPARINCGLCGYSMISNLSCDRIYYPPCPRCGQWECEWVRSALKPLDHIHPKVLFPKLFKF